MVRHVVEGLRSDAAAKGVSLQIEVGAHLLLDPFEPVRAEEVVRGLLDHVIKFTLPSGSVHVALASAGDFALLIVTGNGHGIAPEFIDNAFEPLIPAGRPAPPGADGMARVRELVQGHGGRVQVHSRVVGRGAEFSVWIPQQRQPSAAASAPRVPSVLGGQRLLLVDDSVDSLQSFAMLLRLEGAVVSTAAGGAEALAAMDRERFDLLISDLGMPRMSGHELMRAVRARPDGQALQALACSGYGCKQDEKQSLGAGFDALVKKPTSLQQVEAAVARLRSAGKLACGADSGPGLAPPGSQDGG